MDAASDMSSPLGVREKKGRIEGWKRMGLLITLNIKM